MNVVIQFFVWAFVAVMTLLGLTLLVLAFTPVESEIAGMLLLLLVDDPTSPTEQQLALANFAAYIGPFMLGLGILLFVASFIEDVIGERALNKVYRGMMLVSVVVLFYLGTQAGVAEDYSEAFALWLVALFVALIVLYLAINERIAKLEDKILSADNVSRRAGEDNDPGPSRSA